MRFTLTVLLTIQCFFTIAQEAPDSSYTDFQSRSTFTWLDPSPVPDKGRTLGLAFGYSGLYVASMSWLYTQWYTDYPLIDFHTFNDYQEWEQMDKFAHAWNAYNIAKPVSQTFSWAGYNSRKAACYGSGISLLFQTTVEVFDGFSEEWGFSTRDMLANVVGTSAFLVQQLGWEEQRIVLKYSFHTTNYAQYRPDVLGSNFPERLLKDYNGLTHWVSINPASFLRNTSVNLPVWMSLAIGFGAEGMTGGTSNPTSVDGTPLPTFDRYRQYYLGIDFDLARIKTKSRFLNDLFKLINIVHLPAPALELSPGRKPRWHAFYF
jgi:hypothetical protein